jgi:glycosyltransferase involved in cell wall biosynthesis
VLLAAQGEAPRLAETAGAALQVPPGDPEALAAAVRRLRDDPALREKLADAGRGFGAENLRERQARRLGELIEGLG